MLLGGISARSGVSVNPLTVMGVPTVFACVRRISNTIASTPVHLMRTQNGRTEKVPANPGYDLLAAEPNPWMSPVDFLDAVQSQVTLRQNGIAVINFDNNGRAAELIPVDDIRNVTWKMVDNRLVYNVGAKDYDQREILHIRANAKNGIDGSDIVYTLRNSIGLAVALQDNASDFFANGSRPSGVFEHPGALGDKAYARLKSSLNKKWGDADNPEGMKAYETLLLEEGMKYSETRHTNRDSQMEEARIHQNNEIARIFGVPPHKVGILDKASFNNIEEQSREYVQDTILPWVVRWEHELNRKLLTRKQRIQGFHYLFNLDALLRANLKSRYEAYQIGIQNGIINKNEAREKENLPPYSDGEIFIEPMNFHRVGTQPQGAENNL